MQEQLQAIKDAMDRLDFATARDLSTNYVRGHPEEFTDYVAMVNDSANESEAIAKVVEAVEKLRDAGLVEHQMRAEAFHFYRWHPQNIGGTFAPTVRPEAAVHPTVRNV